MAVNTTPPQAYTKETLVSAYNWLLSQGEHVKALATTPEVLVGLYLKSLRENGELSERPSIKNFRNELKSLTGIMGDLEANSSKEAKEQVPPAGGSGFVSPTPPSPISPQPSPVVPQTASGGSYSAQSSVYTYPRDYAATKKASLSGEPRAHFLENNHVNGLIGEDMTKEGLQNISSDSILRELDSKSILIVQNIRIHFNLGSDIEALRLLIMLGNQRAKKVLQND